MIARKEHWKALQSGLILLYTRWNQGASTHDKSYQFAKDLSQHLVLLKCLRESATARMLSYTILGPGIKIFLPVLLLSTA
jgi:hypothetical protein